MKTASTIDHATNGQGLAMELLSVDADAHLEKLTAHMFPSPALLPVELVRSALKRNAATVSIHVRSERIVISDDGDGIDSAEWQALACLGDSGQSAAAREKAMALIQGLALPGIGLLAVFMPGVRSLQIENAGPSGAGTLHMAAGRSQLQNGSSWLRGTRISIRRRRGPSAEEKVLLAQLCAAVQAEIHINGRLLMKKPLLIHNLAAMNVTLAENSGPSLLAVPVQGDVCRVWLLDQGIPWQITTMAPVQGLVFVAALETASQLTAPALETLAADANRLYQWLAENFEKFPERFQSRIENLFFKQARAAADPGWLSICATFRTWPSGRRISLAEVRRRAADGVLHAMDYNGQPGPTSAKLGERSLLPNADRPISSARIVGRSVLPNADRPISSARIVGRSVLPNADRPISSARIVGRSVLLLTMAQKDFLIHHLHLPIMIMDPQHKDQVRTHRIFTFLRNRFLNWQRSFMSIGTKIPDCSSLSPEEISFCRELEMHGRQKLALMESDKSITPPSVLMVEGRGLLPVRCLKTKNGPMVMIRRSHPLVQRSLTLFRQDRENSELAFAALMPDRFLTDEGH